MHRARLLADLAGGRLDPRRDPDDRAAVSILARYLAAELACFISRCSSDRAADRAMSTPRALDRAGATSMIGHRLRRALAAAIARSARCCAMSGACAGAFWGSPCWRSVAAGGLSLLRLSSRRRRRAFRRPGQAIQIRLDRRRPARRHPGRHLQGAAAIVPRLPARRGLAIARLCLRARDGPAGRHIEAAQRWGSTASR